MLYTFDFGLALFATYVRPTGGSACLVLADPEAGATIAAHLNGNAALTERVRCDHALCTAVCRDLGLAAPGDPGRAHLAPTSASSESRPPWGSARLVGVVRWCDAGWRRDRPGDSWRADGT
ncbi:hypothetical protein ACQ4WX_46325 [Streptomyces lasalocidi]